MDVERWRLSFAADKTGDTVMRFRVWRGWMSIIGLIMLAANHTGAETSLPTIFGDHMVIQRDQAVPVWGWDDPGRKVTVTLGGTTREVTADDAGRWRVDFPSLSVGGPLSLVVSGSSEQRFGDILVGEVWLCSGQSNMSFTVRSAIDYEREKASADYPAIRHITVPRDPSGLPRKDVKPCSWKVCSPDTVGGFSAVAYFFGRRLHRDLDVPIGLINSSWGGTRIEPWTPLVGFEQVPALKDIVARVRLTLPTTPEHKEEFARQLDIMARWLAEARQALRENRPVSPQPKFPAELLPMTSHQDPTTLYNGMILGLVPYALRGAIWYQGESNHGEGMLYLEKMKALIGGWRTVWSKPDLPFYFVQIAPFGYGNEDPEILPRFWEAQAAAAKLPGTGMAVINDVGNPRNIHPRNKQAVGKRLALLALAKTYGKQGVVWSGPTYRDMRVEGSRLHLRFDHVGGGLASRDGKPLTKFEIHDAEGEEFVPADAVIEGNEVVLSAAGVSKPVAARFAWHKIAEPNLMNKEGLPAAPFRCGTVPRIDYLARAVPEASEYELVYDLDLHSLGSTIHYAVDRSAEIKAPFDRVAYFLELKRSGEKTRYVYVSMDTFTDDPTKLGIPTVASKAHFQTNVSHMRVVSNAEGIVTGEIPTGGNIEFWPNNYGPVNVAEIPGASSELWDFGDDARDPVQGYGCMQIHNAAAKQTLFAINCWQRGNGADLGIGNSPPTPVVPHGNGLVSKTRDWTFQANAGLYKTRRLRVLVHLKK